MWPPFCLTTSCKRTLVFVTTFRHKSSESARHNFTTWALSCATFSGLLWNTFSFKNPHKNKSHGLISGLWGGHSCTDTGGTRPPLHQHRTIIFKLLAKSVNFLFARSPPCTKVCTKNVSESLLHSLFLYKQYNFHLLIYSQPPVVRHFTNCWHLSHFPWTTAFTRTFATSILWCYNFNGMIKWYDISCATLYFWLPVIIAWFGETNN